MARCGADQPAAFGVFEEVRHRLLAGRARAKNSGYIMLRSNAFGERHARRHLALVRPCALPERAYDIACDAHLPRRSRPAARALPRHERIGRGEQY